MAPKLCGPKRGIKSSRKRSSCETEDKPVFPESKRTRLVALENEKKHAEGLEKMETEKASLVEEKQTSDGRDKPNVVSPQNFDLEVNGNSRTVESKIVPSFGKSRGGPTRNTSTNVAKRKELLPTRRSQLEEDVIETEENTVKGVSVESVNSPEEFENIVKSLVFKILELASETTGDSCEVALRRISMETSSLLKSRYEIGIEMPREIIAGSSREVENTVNTNACDVTAEKSSNEKTKNLCQSYIHEDKCEKMSNTLQADQVIGTKELSKTDGTTTAESKLDLCKTRKEDDDGCCLIVEDERNKPSEKREVSCVTSTVATKCTAQEVQPKGAKEGESLRQQTEQDRHQEDIDVLVDQQTTSLDEPDVTACKTTSEQNKTAINVDQIQEDVSGTSKGSDELPQHEDIVSGDAKSLSASGHNTEKPTTSSAQANSNEGDLPGCVDLLDFTNSQLLQIEEAETELIQQEASGPSSKGEGNSRPIQRVQDEDIDSVASRRREEDRRDDRRVKEIMQKMMKDLNEIKLVTGSLLSQMTQYRKHRSQRQPQPSRLTGTHVTSSGFYRGKQSKGSGPSQFKKS